MKRMKITCKDRSLLKGFFLGIEWVNDSATEVLECDDHSLLLLDADGDDEVLELELTEEGLE